MRYTVSPHGLAPFDQAANEFLATRHDAEPFELQVVNQRDVVEERRIMAQIGDLAKALRRPPEKVRAELLFKTGHFQVIGDMFGKTMIAIDSMSRRHMTDTTLHEFWDDACEIIRNEMLPEIRDAAERERVASMLLPEREFG